MYLTWDPLTWALTSGGWPLYSVSFSFSVRYVIGVLLLTATGEKKGSSHSLVFLRDTCLGTERRAQIIRTCSIFEQWEPWTEPQVNPRWSWANWLLNTWYLKGWICAWAGWSGLPAPGAEVSLSACSSARPGAVKSMKISFRDQLTTSAVTLFGARICKRLRGPGIDSWAYVTWAGMFKQNMRARNWAGNEGKGLS
jgi:hypothetical protein